MTAPPIRTFGRTKSRTLKPARAALLAELLPRLAIPSGRFDPGQREVWLEIGFGGGEHLAEQAQRWPDVLFLGAEPFLNGVSSMLQKVLERDLSNVRLWPGDARELMATLPDASLTRIFLLFPDPWPKTRHHKRRLVDAAFVAEAARLLKSNGRLRFATDWADYANQTLEVFIHSPAFVWTAARADDWRLAPADHVPTRYEAKALGDCRPIWLEFERV
ncbi:MAG TPA: tRNA (guanosine(46)-N7)-methyltransferase TrmB [Caulobacteraceae bacterium]|jgi:tRNA (guanine-N7-)-methyltransferase